MNTALRWAAVCALAGPVASLCLFAQTQPPAALQAANHAAVTPSWGTERIGRTDSIFLDFAEPLDQLGPLAIVIGQEDMTVHFKPAGPKRLQASFAQTSLPKGEHQVQVMQVVSPTDWQEMASLPLSVADIRRGLRLAGTVGVKGQAWSEQSGTARAPARPTYTDATSQITLNTEGGDEDLNGKGVWHLIGTSFRNEAVQYPVQGQAAPKPDLISYTLEGHADTGMGRSAISLGQVTMATHPLLAPSVNNRGLTLSHAFGSRFDVALGIQAGAQLLGSQNIMGVEDPQTRFTSVRMGFEALPDRPGGLRFELGWFNGHIAPSTQYNVSPAIVETQRSHGWGWRVSGSTEDGRLVADLNTAVSRYQSEDTGYESASGAQHAHSVNLSYQLLPPTDWGTVPVELTAVVREDFTQALFRSLGGGPVGDFKGRSIGLNGMVSDVMWSWTVDTTEDNVEDDPLFEKSRSRNTTLSLTLPLARLPILAKHPAWPQLSWSTTRSHTWGDARFIPQWMIDAEMGAADLPDTLNTERKVGLQWAWPGWTLAWRYTTGLQDNLQALYADQDMASHGHQIDVNWRPRPQLSVGMNLGHTSQRMTDTQERNQGEGLGLDVRWTLSPRLQLWSAFTRSQALNAVGPTWRTFDTLQLGLNGKKPLTSWMGRQLTGLWFVRLAASNNKAKSKATGLSSSAGLHALQSGFNIAF